MTNRPTDPQFRQAYTAENFNQQVKQPDQPPVPGFLNELIEKSDELKGEIFNLGRRIKSIKENPPKKLITAHIATDLVSSKQVYSQVLSVLKDPVEAAHRVNVIGALPLVTFFSYLSSVGGLTREEIDHYFIRGLYFEGDGYKLEVADIDETISALAIGILKKINCNLNIYLQGEFTDTFGEVKNGATFMRFRGLALDQKASRPRQYIHNETIALERQMKANTDGLTVTDPYFSVPYVTVNSETSSFYDTQKTETYKNVTRLSLESIHTYFEESLNLSEASFIGRMLKIFFYADGVRHLLVTENYKDYKARKEFVAMARDCIVQSFISEIEQQFAKDKEKHGLHYKIQYDGRRIMIFSASPVSAEALEVKSNKVLQKILQVEVNSSHPFYISKSAVETIGVGSRSLVFYYFDIDGKRIPCIESPNPAIIYLYETLQHTKNPITITSLYNLMEQFTRERPNSPLTPYVNKYIRKMLDSIKPTNNRVD